MSAKTPFKYSTEITFPDICIDPLGEIEIFLRVNGYLFETVDGVLKAERGEKGRGFWTSDLTVLPTLLTVELKERRIFLNYQVDGSGQILSKEEKNFWKKEAKAIENYLDGEEIENFLEIEKNNAEEIRSRMLKQGLYFSAIISFVIFFLFLFLTRR